MVYLVQQHVLVISHFFLFVLRHVVALSEHPESLILDVHLVDNLQGLVVGAVFTNVVVGRPDSEKDSAILVLSNRFLDEILSVLDNRSLALVSFANKAREVEEVEIGQIRAEHFNPGGLTDRLRGKNRRVATRECE